MTRNHSTRITTGIFLVGDDTETVPLPFNVDSFVACSEPWYIARLSLCHILEQLDANINSTGIDINTIETATGQHSRWDDENKLQNAGQDSDPNADAATVDPLQIDFMAMTTDLSKAGHDVAGLAVCTKGVILAADVLDELDLEGREKVEESRNQCKHMLLAIDYLQTRRDALLSVVGPLY